jgi:hypothetical protein
VKRCLVTGGAGFIGSALVHYLLSGQEADVPIAKKCKVAFKIQSPVNSRCGMCHKPQNAGFGGWAGEKYQPPVRSFLLLGLPVFHKNRFVVVGLRADVLE